MTGANLPLIWAQQLARPEWFVPLFCCFWMAICASIAVLGGWSSLSQEFRTDDQTPGERFRMTSAAIGKWPFPVASYRGCLFVTVARDGFRLSVLWLFRFMHPPLFVPWSAVERIETRRFFLMDYVVVWLRRGWPSIALRGAAGRRVIAQYAAVRSEVSAQSA